MLSRYLSYFSRARIIYMTNAMASHFIHMLRTRPRAPEVITKAYVLPMAPTIACKTWACVSGSKARRNAELVPEIADLIRSGLVPGRTAPICCWATLRKIVFANVNAMTMPPICARLMKAIASEIRKEIKKKMMGEMHYLMTFLNEVRQLEQQ